MKVLDKNRIEILEQFPKGMYIAEIGTDKGIYAKHIYKFAKPKYLFLIDCWKQIIADSVYAKDPVNSKDDIQEKKYNLVQRKFAKTNNVTLVRKMSYESADDFDDKYFDCVYIDADHSYSGCLTDLRLWSNKIKLDGFIWGHDYTNSFKWIQVKEAIDTFLNENPEWELYAITNEDPKKSPSWFLTRENSKIKNSL
jgi:hypothetical protein